MPFKNRLLLGSLLVLLAGLLTIVSSPFLVSEGLRFWVWWKARQQKLTVKIAKIEASLFRPVVLRNIRVTSAPDAAFRIDITAAQATLDLNLKAIVLRLRGRGIHTLSVQGLRAELHAENDSGKSLDQRDWLTLQKLLPDNLNVDRFDLRMEDGARVILLRNVSFAASEIEPGHFYAGEVTIVSPWFRQTFSQLRGATNWHDNRLTLAALSLTRGLDVQSITADLSHLGKQRVGLEFDVDAFGGKIRASIVNEWRSHHSTWSVAGSATDISLEQTSEAIGFTDRVGGLLHACKFTYRGDPRDATHVTASLWTELTALSWRDRTAEVIMLGAALYNRQIELQQLYVKQHENQLTLSGEGALPSQSSDWLSPAFRGDISASINDLGVFARLFGADPDDFAGKIAIEGTMNARDRKIGGRLMVDGKSLTIFKTPIDFFNARLNLKATELEIEDLEMTRKKDFLSAQGKIDMSHEHNYSGTLNARVSNLSEYLSIFAENIPHDAKPTSAEIQTTIDSGVWNARAVATIPSSSPFILTVKFPLPIGKNITPPLEATFDFPAVFLANAPRCFHSEIFQDGILSGKLSLSGTFQRPRVVGDIQLLNGKLQNAPMKLISANGHVTFNGEHASIDFVDAATNDADLSLRGEIDLHDSNDLMIKVSASEAVFDLMPRPIDCVSQIELAPVGITLAPVIEELAFRGGFFASDWTVTLSERGISQSPGTPQSFPLCFRTSPNEKRLTLGVPARPKPESVRPRKRRKAR